MRLRTARGVLFAEVEIASELWDLKPQLAQVALRPISDNLAVVIGESSSEGGVVTAVRRTARHSPIRASSRPHWRESPPALEPGFDKTMALEPEGLDGDAVAVDTGDSDHPPRPRPRTKRANSPVPEVFDQVGAGHDEVEDAHLPGEKQGRRSGEAAESEAPLRCDECATPIAAL